MAVFPRLSGYEHLPPVSVPFRHFLSRLTCWAPAQRRSLGAKIARKLPAHRCFAVSAEQILAEARRRPQGILLYCQGLERSFSPNLPAKTGRGSNPLSLRCNLRPHRRGRRPRRPGVITSASPPASGESAPSLPSHVVATPVTDVTGVGSALRIQSVSSTFPVLQRTPLSASLHRSLFPAPRSLFSFSCLTSFFQVL